MPKAKTDPTKDKFDVTVATIAQVREAEADIAAAEKMLKADRVSGRNKITDEVEFRKGIAEKRELLKVHKPRKLRGASADRAYAEAKELKKIILDAMPTSRGVASRYPKDSDDHEKHRQFEEAVQQQMNFQTNPKVVWATQRYKNIMSHLDPDDPTVRNLENLRRRG